MPGLAQPPRPFQLSGAATGWVALVTASVTAALAVTTMAGVDWASRTADPGTNLERRLPTLLPTLGLLLVAAVGACWLMVAVKPRTAVGLGVALSTSMLGWWGGWAWLTPELRALLPALSVVGAPALAAAVLGWRTEAIARSAARLWTLSAVAAGAAALGHMAAYDPARDLDCLRTCRHAETLTAAAGVGHAEALLSIAAVLAVLAVGSALTLVAGPATRRAPVTLRVTGSGALLAIGAAWVLGGRLVVDDAEIPIDVVVAAATMLAAVAGGAAALHVHVLRRTAGALIRQLQDGRVAPTAEPHWEHADLAPAQQLALTNARLESLALDRVAQTRAEQQQMIRLADDERWRIERDLHDGAQQQLVTAALHLGVATAHVDASASGSLGRATQHVLEALAALRLISHGIFPPVLTDDGLVAALEDLVAEHGGRLEVQAGDKVDLAGTSSAARTAYVVLDEVLHALAPGAQVALRRSAELHMVVTSPVPSQVCLTRAAADRLEAMSGSLVVEAHPGETRVEVLIPCEW